ncbi:MAG: hypothetical protein ACR2MD_17725 [Aridibacter sp.]|jgi:hypothetical protein|nr:hypothetical protein [Acidobacteriota bacterium]
MNLDIVKSVNDVPIRLTDERWFEHILSEHPYMSRFYEDVLGTIENPEFVLRGYQGSKMAVKNVGRKQWLHVIYREINKNDGFIISAYLKPGLDRNKIIWQLDL